MTVPGEPPAEEAATPLESLRAALGGRIWNALMREGLTTVEEVASAPDSDLLKIGPLGANSIKIIRAVIQTTGASSYRMDHDVLIPKDQVPELVALLSTLAARGDRDGPHDLAQRARAFLDQHVGRQT